MGGRKLFTALIGVMAVQPCLAEGPIAIAVQPAAHTPAIAPSDQTGRTNAEIHAAIIAAPMAGTIESAAAANRERDIRRLLPAGSSAESALLTPTGLPSLIAACSGPKPVPLLPCHILTARDRAR